MKRLNAVLTLSAMTALVGMSVGCGPSWVYIKQANPNPLVGQKAFAIEPVSYEGMKIGNPGAITEQEWIQKKKPEEQPKFLEDLKNSKERFNARFIEFTTSRASKSGVSVTPAAGQGGTWTLKPQVIEFEGGFNAFVMTSPAVVRLHIKVVDPQGQEVDVIELRGSADAGSFGAMVTRLGMLGEQFGNRMGEYLNTRTAAAK